MTNITLLIFSVIHNKLMVFAPDKNPPTALWDGGETIEKEAIRTLGEAGLSSTEGHLEQLYTVSDKKDITIVYYFLVPGYRITKTSGWVSSIASSHFTYAVQRLRWKIEYTNIVYSLLPNKFTLGEIQKVYEAILNKPLDKRNFRKKILSLGMLKDTGRKKKLGRARPAEVYTFLSRKPTIVEIL